MLSRRAKLIALSAFLALSAGGLMATVMSGGLLQIIASVMGGAGSSTLAGGNLSLSHSVGQPNVIAMTGGAFELISGYQMEFNGVLGSTPTLPSPVVDAGVSIGVSTTGTVTITFQEPMDPATIDTSFSIIALRDRNGQAVVPPVVPDVLLAYDDATATLSISPAFPWDTNTLYTIVLSTVARTALGTHLPVAFTKKFLTVFDCAQDNTFVDPYTGDTIVALPARTLPSSGYLVMKVDPMTNPDRINPSIIEVANRKLALNLGAVQTPVAIREINAYDLNGNPINITPGALANLALKYASDPKGFVPRSIPLVRTASLALWTLDENRSLWIKVPGTVNSNGVGEVAAPIYHFSVYALIGVQNTAVSDVYPFPVPWKPRAGNAARYGTLSGGITFTNLPTSGSIRIYTVTGELVNTISIPTSSLTVSWYGTNSSGESVASGVYLWEIEADNSRKTGKLMVVW